LTAAGTANIFAPRVSHNKLSMPAEASHPEPDADDRLA
jgi:hypothetical protein